MRNKLSDLNNYLFEQLERLNDDELNDNELSKEIKRSKAVVDVASKINEIAMITVKAQQIICEYDRKPGELEALRAITCAKGN